MFCDIVHNEAIISLLELSTTTESLFRLSQRDRKCSVSQKCSFAN
jgi:hypothetical protein